MNNNNKPWEEIPARIWTWLTADWRKYITIPIFLIGFTIPIVFNDSYKKCFSFFQNLFEDKKSYPTKDEEDVFNEWVVLVSTIADKTDAYKQINDFKYAYIKSKHEVWKHDILLVRNPKQTSEWQIVIDTYPGPSTKEDVQGAIENMWNYCKSDRDIENTLGRWLYGARAIFYDSTKFVKTYGHIVKD